MKLLQEAKSEISARGLLDICHFVDTSTAGGAGDKYQVWREASFMRALWRRHNDLYRARFSHFPFFINRMSAVHSRSEKFRGFCGE